MSGAEAANDKCIFGGVSLVRAKIETCPARLVLIFWVADLRLWSGLHWDSGRDSMLVEQNGLKLAFAEIVTFQM